MKNNLSIFLSLSLVIFVATGCNGLVEYIPGGGDTGSDAANESTESLTENSEKPAASDEKTAESGETVKVGIPECDELATFINNNSEAIEGSVVARGIVYFYKNMVLEKIKAGVEKMSEAEKQQTASACTKSLEELKRSLGK